MNEVVKFLNDLKRMCDKSPGCCGCKISPLQYGRFNCNSTPTSPLNVFTRYPEKVYEIVTEWANNNPDIVITEKGLVILKYLKAAEKNYLTRDSDNYLYGYPNKPEKKGSGWCGYGRIRVAETLTGQFPFITWEQEEPWLVDDLIKIGEGKANG